MPPCFATLELDFIWDELRCSGKGRGLGFTKADEFKAAKVLSELVILRKFPIFLNFTQFSRAQASKNEHARAAGRGKSALDLNRKGAIFTRSPMKI